MSDMRDLLARRIVLWCYSRIMFEYDEDFIETMLMNTGCDVPIREKAAHQSTPQSRLLDPEDYQLISLSAGGS